MTLLCILIVITQAIGIPAYGATSPPSNIHPATSEDISLLNQKIIKIINENNLQASTIESLKQDNNRLESTIAQQSKVISELNQKITDTIKENELQESTINILKSTIASLEQSKYLHTSTISDLNKTNTDFKKEMTEVKQKRKQRTTVMFSAYLLHRQITFSPSEVVVFDRAVTNIGQHYNQATGVFTCPISGYYVFDVHIFGQNDKRASVDMRRNGLRIVQAWADDKLDYQSASGYVTVVLKKGDKVAVMSWGTSYMSCGYGRCMFSGHLVNLL